MNKEFCLDYREGCSVDRDLCRTEDQVGSSCHGNTTLVYSTVRGMQCNTKVHSTVSARYQSKYISGKCLKRQHHLSKCAVTVGNLGPPKSPHKPRDSNELVILTASKQSMRKALHQKFHYPAMQHGKRGRQRNLRAQQRCGQPTRSGLTSERVGYALSAMTESDCEG